MDLLLNQTLKEQFTRRFTALESGFVVVRMAQKKNGSGDCLLERRIDSRHKAWISFGGVKDSDDELDIEAGWTTEGGGFSSLPLVWLGDRPWPTRGLFLPLLEGQFGEGPTAYTGLCKRIALPGPPEQLRELAMRRFMEGGEFQRELEGMTAWEARKKIPASADKIRENVILARRVILTLWSGILRGLPPEETAEAVEAACTSALDELFVEIVPKTVARLERLVGNEG